MRKDEAYRFITVKEFTESFQSFHAGRKLGDELAVPFEKVKSHPSALATEKYGVSKKELLKACASRQYLLMKRNAFLYMFNMVQVSSISNLSIFLETFLKMLHNIKGNLDENHKIYHENP